MLEYMFESKSDPLSPPEVIARFDEMFERHYPSKPRGRFNGSLRWAAGTGEPHIPPAPGATTRGAERGPAKITSSSSAIAHRLSWWPLRVRRKGGVEGNPKTPDPQGVNRMAARTPERANANRGDTGAGRAPLPLPLGTPRASVWNADSTHRRAGRLLSARVRVADGCGRGRADRVDRHRRRTAGREQNGGFPDGKSVRGAHRAGATDENRAGG
jgi:hypothetical protein